MADEYDSAQWRDAEAALSVPGEHVLLWGPPGTGKTYAAERVGAIGNGWRAITTTTDTTPQQLVGYYVNAGPAGWTWRDGPAAEAWRDGLRLAVNEIGEASGDVLTALYAITNDRETAVERLDNGEVLRPDPAFQLVATTNAHPTRLPDALVERLVVVNITDPAPGLIRALPIDLQPLAWNAGRVTDYDRRVSPRRVLRYARLRDLMPVDVAARLAFGERAPEVLDALKVGGAWS